MNTLLTSGVTTFPVLENPSHWRALLENAFVNDPVFVEPTEDMVMGAFCGLGTPHSHHCEEVRQLREEIFNKMMPHWSNHRGAVELLPDRVMLRPSTKRPTGESWHRDESPNTKEGFVTGGWVNLNDFPEHFCCVPGTHSLNGGTGGFATIDKSEHADYKARSELVEVLPGHAIVFFENIVHKIFPGKKVKRWRQFVGWRFSTQGEPFDPDMFERIRTLQTLRIKSGHECPMYARLHLTNWIERLAEWSKNVKDEHCRQHLVQSGKNTGKTFRICKRYIRGCRDAHGDSPYSPYTDREVEILRPQWQLEPLAPLAPLAHGGNDDDDGVDAENEYDLTDPFVNDGDLEKLPPLKLGLRPRELIMAKRKRKQTNRYVPVEQLDSSEYDTDYDTDYDTEYSDDERETKRTRVNEVEQRGVEGTSYHNPIDLVN